MCLHHAAPNTMWHSTHGMRWTTSSTYTYILSNIIARWRAQSTLVDAGGRTTLFVFSTFHTVLLEAICCFMPNECKIMRHIACACYKFITRHIPDTSVSLRLSLSLCYKTPEIERNNNGSNFMHAVIYVDVC